MDDFALAVGREIHQPAPNVPHQNPPIRDLLHRVLQLVRQSGNHILGGSDLLLAAGMAVASAPAQQTQQVLLLIDQSRAQRLHGGEPFFQPRHQVVGLIVSEQPLHHSVCIIQQ